MKTGYKGTYNFICKNHKFKIGKTYELPYKPIVCSYGFHYCLNPVDVLKYYPINSRFNLLEIEDLSNDTVTQGNKSATNKIRIIREILKEEYSSLMGFIGNELTVNYENGQWKKFQYNERNNCIYYEDNSGYWRKHEYNENNKLIYYENSFGYCCKHEYNENNKLIYYENSDGCCEKY